MNQNNKQQALIKTLEAASQSLYTAEHYADSITTDNLLSAPHYLKESIKEQTVLLKKSKHTPYFKRKEVQLFHYSLKVCFTVCCSLFFLFSDYSSDSAYFSYHRTVAMEKPISQNKINHFIKKLIPMEDHYYD